MSTNRDSEHKISTSLLDTDNYVCSCLQYGRPVAARTESQTDTGCTNDQRPTDRRNYTRTAVTDRMPKRFGGAGRDCPLRARSPQPLSIQ